MLGEHGAAHLDRRDEAVGDAAFARMGDQGVDGALPVRLRNARGDAVVGDDAGIMLGERDEDQDAGTVALSRDRAGEELLGRDPEGHRPARPARDQRHAHPRQAEEERQRHEDDELPREDGQRPAAR